MRRLYLAIKMTIRYRLLTRGPQYRRTGNIRQQFRSYWMMADKL